MKWNETTNVIQLFNHHATYKNNKYGKLRKYLTSALNEKIVCFYTYSILQPDNSIKINTHKTKQNISETSVC